MKRQLQQRAHVHASMIICDCTLQKHCLAICTVHAFKHWMCVVQVSRENTCFKVQVLCMSFSLSDTLLFFFASLWVIGFPVFFTAYACQSVCAVYDGQCLGTGWELLQLSRDPCNYHWEYWTGKRSFISLFYCIMLHLCNIRFTVGITWS